MKQFDMGSILGMSVLCLLTATSSLKAGADTVTLQIISTGSNSAYGEITYPYYFSVNGGPATTPLMCLDFFNDIYYNESWTATIEPISGVLYQEAAWLYNDANVNASNPTTAEDDQLAAWGLFATGVPGSNNDQLTLAQQFVANNPNDTSFYSNFQVYVPLSGWPSNDDSPQIFLGETPEPSSLVLLATGLLFFAGAVYRRRRPHQIGRPI